MNPDVITAFFISLHLTPPSLNERFTITYADGILEIYIHRKGGSIEQLVLINMSNNNSFDKLEVFDPKSLGIEERNALIRNLTLGRKHSEIARIFQMGESAICKILKKGNRS